MDRYGRREQGGCGGVGRSVCQADWCIQWGEEQDSVMKCCHPREALTSVIS